jgi:hypothetical protein
MQGLWFHFAFVCEGWTKNTFEDNFTIITHHKVMCGSHIDFLQVSVSYNIYSGAALACSLSGSISISCIHFVGYCTKIRVFWGFTLSSVMRLFWCFGGTFCPTFKMSEFCSGGWVIGTIRRRGLCRLYWKVGRILAGDRERKKPCNLPT